MISNMDKNNITTMNVDELLSNWMDGELSSSQAKELLNMLFINPELQSKWRHWKLIREVMRLNQYSYESNDINAI